MKVLITTPNSINGGVASFCENIIYYLPNDVIIFKRGNRNGYNNITDSFLMPLLYIWTIITKKTHKVIINTSLSKACLIRDGLLVFISKLFCKKTLLVIHGFRKSALKHKFILKQGYFRADSIIVLADEFKEYLEAAGYKKNIYIQYNPVSKDILQTEISNRDLSKLDDILFISRIELAKGVYILLDTYKQLKENHPNLKLHIAGDGTELDNVREYISTNNIQDVILYGYINGVDKINLINNTDIFIFPTYNEGLPISVLESMALGQVVITRPVGGLVDLHKACDFGAMIESLDVIDYVKAYEELVSNKEKLMKIRNNNIQFAQENFSPQTITNKMLEILNNL